MKKHDFIPQGDEDFPAWSRNFIALIALNAGAWGIPQAAATFLQSLQVIISPRRIMRENCALG
jgi:hypothetical protein